MEQREIQLVASCEATRIPSGESITLPEGGTFWVTQALGGSVTVRDAGGLYRVGPEHFKALGAIASELIAEVEKEESLEGEFSESQVWAALRQCFDPEIPVNIVDLGLIYDLQISEEAKGKHMVAVKMTLTAPGCGMGPTIAHDAATKIEGLAGVSSAVVDIVWDPQWVPQMISAEGRKILGLG